MTLLSQGLRASDSIGAMYIASEAHGEQTDFDGTPHYEHVLRVAHSVPRACAIVAWLHDVIEDTDVTLDDLDARGLAPLDRVALGLLTRSAGEKYEAYIGSIARYGTDAGRVARLVKEADLIDNLTRCLRGKPSERAKSLIPRYRKALVQIQTAILEENV